MSVDELPHRSSTPVVWVMPVVQVLPFQWWTWPLSSSPTHRSSPEVPPGWSMAYGVSQRPGSLVRLRSDTVPDAAMQAYEESLRGDELDAPAWPAASIAPPAPITLPSADVADDVSDELPAMP